MDRPSAHPDRRLDLIPVALAVAAGGLLSAVDLGTRSLWLDEASTFAIASQHGAALWHAIAHDGGNMLGYYLLIHVVIGWFGDSAWLLRLPSVVATAATGGLVAAVCLRLFPGNRRLAAAAGLLSVVSLPLVFWGQNARGYALLVALSVGSFLALAAILQTPQERGPARTAVIAYTLTTLAALYVGYDAALLIPGQLALLIVYRRRAPLVIGCLAIAFALSIPLVVLALERGAGQLFWVTPLSASVAGSAAVTLLSVLPPSLHSTATTAVAVAVMAVSVITAIAVGALALLRARPLARSSDELRSGEAGPVLFVFCWVLVPAALTLIVYAAGEPIELQRVTILGIPPLSVLVAWLLWRPSARPLLAVVAMTVLIGLRLAQVIPSYGVSPEPWNTATAYVLRHTPAGPPACIAFYPEDGREAFDYYLLHDAGASTSPVSQLRPVLPTPAWRTIRPYVEDYAGLDPGQRARIEGECPRLWLISSHIGQTNGTPQSRANLHRFDRLEDALQARYPHTMLRAFGWSSTIDVRLLRR